MGKRKEGKYTYPYRPGRKPKYKSKKIRAIIEQEKSPISTRRIEKTLGTIENLDVSTSKGMQRARGLINKLITDLDEAKKSGSGKRVENILSSVEADTDIKKQWVAHIKKRINL